jgi:hypothetical protein
LSAIENRRASTRFSASSPDDPPRLIEVLDSRRLGEWTAVRVRSVYWYSVTATRGGEMRERV